MVAVFDVPRMQQLRHPTTHHTTQSHHTTQPAKSRVGKIDSCGRGCMRFVRSVVSRASEWSESEPIHPIRSIVSLVSHDPASRIL